MSRVAVLVPVYNVAPYLKRSVDSLLAQTYTDFDLLLVDDGSTDESATICDEYAAKDKRVTVIHQENRGVAAARNTGLDWALTKSLADYIAFVDPDDWVSDNYLETLLSGVSRGVDIARVGYYQISDSKHAYAQFLDTDWMKYSPEEYASDPTVQWHMWAILYKKDLWEGIRFPPLELTEDTHTLPRVLAKAKSMLVRRTPLYYYYLRSNSLMHETWSLRQLDAVAAFADQVEFFAEIGWEAARHQAEINKCICMTKSIQYLSIIDAEKAKSYANEVESARRAGKLPFWESRELYRYLMGRSEFAVRWFVGMLGNFLKKRGSSWLVREAWPIFKSLVCR